ncbi:MAG: hypothetical protein ACR2GN_11100 [Bacteroidia bacterium]
MKLLIFLSFYYFLHNSCISIESSIQGDWAIHEIDAPFTILDNSLSFKENKICELPLSSLSERYTSYEIGQWTIFKKNGKNYLKISSDNWRFNDIYEIKNMQTYQDPISLGYLITVTFESRKTKMICVRPKI